MLPNALGAASYSASPVRYPVTSAAVLDMSALNFFEYAAHLCDATHHLTHTHVVRPSSADEVVCDHLIGCPAQLQQVLQEKVPFPERKSEPRSERRQQGRNLAEIYRSGVHRSSQYPSDLLTIVAVGKQVDDDPLRCRCRKPGDGHHLACCQDRSVQPHV